MEYHQKRSRTRAGYLIIHVSDSEAVPLNGSRRQDVVSVRVPECQTIGVDEAPRLRVSFFPGDTTIRASEHVPGILLGLDVRLEGYCTGCVGVGHLTKLCILAH